MKKIFARLVCILAFVLCLSFAANADSNISITLNGTPIDCASYGQEATIVEGRTLVPLRAIFEALGASVEWDQSSKTVTSTLGDTTIRLTIGENKLYKNSTEVKIDVPAAIMNGRTMVPARAVAESFGVSVGWSAEKRTVVLMTVPNEPVAKYNADLENRLAMLIPKEALDNEILATVGGIPVSGAAVRYAEMMGKSYFTNYGLPEEEVKELSEGVYRQNAGLITSAYKNYITLTDEEIGAVVEEVKLSLEYFYGDMLSEALETSPYTMYFYCLNAVYSTLYNKLYETLTSDADSEFMTQLRTEIFDYLEENDYVRAKHILIMFPDGEGKNGEISNEQRAETLKKANAVLKEVNAMSDISEFDALVEKYNDDPGMESYPGGYYFTRGEMVSEFETATYGLEEGKTSGIIETIYGYHIILRLPFEDESLRDSMVYYDFIGTRIVEMLDDEGASLELVYADNHAERAEDFRDEYDKIYS